VAFFSRENPSKSFFRSKRKKAKCLSGAVSLCYRIRKIFLIPSFRPISSWKSFHKRSKFFLILLPDRVWEKFLYPIKLHERLRFQPRSYLMSTRSPKCSLRRGERIDELTRLGILRPVRSDDPSAPPRYGFLASTQAYLRHLRAEVERSN
jgi:hypothetical protein